jgi:hypothetical protein
MDRKALLASSRDRRVDEIAGGLVDHADELVRSVVTLRKPT